MEFVDGWSPIPEGTTWPPPFGDDLEARRVSPSNSSTASPSSRRSTGRPVALEGFGKPDGFNERQVDRWLAHLAAFQFRPLPGLDVAGRMAALPPARNLRSPASCTAHYPVRQLHVPTWRPGSAWWPSSTGRWQPSVIPCSTLVRSSTAGPRTPWPNQPSAMSTTPGRLRRVSSWTTTQRSRPSGRRDRLLRHLRPASSWPWCSRVATPASSRARPTTTRWEMFGDVVLDMAQKAPTWPPPRHCATTAPPGDAEEGGAPAGKVALVTGGSRGYSVGPWCSASPRPGPTSSLRVARSSIAKRWPAGRSIGAMGVATGRARRALGRTRPVAARAHATFHRVQVLVNNAGMSLLYDSLPAVSEAMWDKVVDRRIEGPDSA